MSEKYRILNEKSRFSLRRPILFVFLLLIYISVSDRAYGLPTPTPTPITNVGCVPGASLKDNGCWTDVFASGPITHATVLPNGSLLNWSSFPPHGWARVWNCILEGADNQRVCNLNPDPNVNQQAWYTGMMDIFCSGHTLMPDGTVMITGGVKHIVGSPEFAEEQTMTFNYNASGQARWQPGPVMYEGRWYPTTIALGNGKVLTASGTYWDQTQAPGHETVVNNIPEILPTPSPSPAPTPQWTKLTGAGDISLPLYPWLYYASNGLVFYAGPTTQSYWLDTNGSGDWLSVAPPVRTTPYRESGSSVMYDVDKVMISGGGPVSPVASNDVIDLGASTPAWRAVAPMAFARKHHNLTILADGKILATGGTKGNGFNNNCDRQVVYESELWTPPTTPTGLGSWSTLAKMSYNRRYHSTAVLLRDGRVMVGGSDQYPSAPAQCNPPLPFVYTTEVFTPPYLFDGNGNLAPRPRVNSFPSQVSYGSQFSVGMNPADSTMSITKVTMIRLSSVTHSFNMNQRINYLTVQQSGASLTITAPTNGNVAPPGHYLMFIINNLGVPSVGEIVKLG